MTTAILCSSALSAGKTCIIMLDWSVIYGGVLRTFAEEAIDMNQDKPALLLWIGWNRLLGVFR
ncbi:hypothetical protein [Nitrosomonas communis]|uniref:hypothetical protein n=1 Tax=Nitrosomonas communis TaxID=44574 RepID=UPI001160B371|nr:hypothetical protein [Nitrosomonas communis]